MWLPSSLLVLAAQTVFARWNDPDAFTDGSDLEHFVTRPDILAPRYVVTKHHPEAVSDGYWFVAPYSGLFARESPGFRKEHVPCQTGAHIYDNDGVLVWSGACEYTNRNVYGFKPIMINGTQFLSFHQSGEDTDDGILPTEANVLLNKNYEEVRRFTNFTGKVDLDLHEFKVLPGGQAAIMALQKVQKAGPNATVSANKTVINPAFIELELATQKTLFNWTGLEKGLSLDESYDVQGKNRTHMWDAFHINSVDKDSDGHYYVSLRHSCTVYKISKDDGSIIWRLGGSRSDFTLGKGVYFQWQHHARVRFHNATHTMLSLFDNGAEDEGRPLKILKKQKTVGKIIMLDTKTKKATLVRSFDRPDKDRSEKLGSVQLLAEQEGQLDDPEQVMQAPVFINWARMGYISEYDSQNRLTLEAHFESDRMKTYRAYKYKFAGHPMDRPTVKILPMAYSQDGHDTASAFYVSWNGATEVSSWAFYGSPSETGPFHQLGAIRKNGFETSWLVPGKVSWGFAAALDASGTVLEHSYLVSLETPSNRNYAVPAASNPPPIMSSSTYAEDETPPRYYRPVPSVMVGTTPKKETDEQQAVLQELPEVLSGRKQSAGGDYRSFNTLFLSLVQLAFYVFAAYGFFCTVRGGLGRGLCGGKGKRSWLGAGEKGLG